MLVDLITLGVVISVLWVVLIHSFGLIGKSTIVQSPDFSQSYRDLAAQIVVDIGEKLDSLKEFDSLVSRKARLEVQVDDLKRQAADLESKFGQKTAELHHAAGLLKKELDAELTRTKAQADLDAQRQILDAEKRFGKEAMDAEREDFHERIAFIERYTERLMDLVPKMEAVLKIRKEG